MHRPLLSVLVAASALLVALPAVGQRPPEMVTVVRAGNLFDAEAGRMVGPREVLIRGDRIAEVAERVTAPEGATVVDLSRCSVLPGLIDAHSHILLTQRPSERLADTTARDAAVDGPAWRMMIGARNAREYLDAGVTSVRDLGNSGRFLDMTLGRAIGDGLIPGPRIYGSGPGLAPAGGQLEPVGDDPHHLVAGEYRIVTGVEDARAAVREAVAAGAMVIKIYPEATPQRTRLAPEEMAAIVVEAKRSGVPVAAHVTSDRGAREAIEAGVTSLEHGNELSDETLRLMADRGVVWVPTNTSMTMARELSRAWPNPPSDEDIRQHLSSEHERLRRAREAGVRIAAGQDLYVDYPAGRGRGSLLVLGAYVEGGMTPAEALQSATLEAGRLLTGEDGRLGVIKAGALADLAAFTDDPTEGLAALDTVRAVMRGGRVLIEDRDGDCAAG